MLRDRYDNEISTTSQDARDLYIAAIDAVLGAAPDMAGSFERVVDADPEFALGHCGLARARMLSGDMPGARSAMAEARSRADGLPAQQAAHLKAIGLLVDGKPAEAYRAVRAHAADYPRDALVVQICTSVFGLIGFSGQPGREAELLSYTASLLPHYGEDWWCLSQHAFSLCEVGRVDEASAMIDLSLTLHPRNAHGAHVRSHVSYEVGETEAGVAYLEDWLKDYDRSGLMHGHLSWHLALWALHSGNLDHAWTIMDADVAPGVALGLPINILTDTASFLYRAELAGETIAPERWTQVSDYASQCFPKNGLAFVDVHSALAHAMAGNGGALDTLIANAAGPAGDLMRYFGEAYRAVAKQSWAEATALLTKAMADHARIGGSRAQRDLLDFTLLGTLLKQGLGDEARRWLRMRRPVLADAAPIAGLYS